MDDYRKAYTQDCLRNNLKEQIVSMIYSDLKVFRRCMGNEEFHRVLSKKDYKALIESEALDEIANTMQSIIERMEKHYYENY